MVLIVICPYLLQGLQEKKDVLYKGMDLKKKKKTET